MSVLNVHRYTSEDKLYQFPVLPSDKLVTNRKQIFHW